MYDKEFYANYVEYLKEPQVRATHNEMIYQFLDGAAGFNTLDLCCGVGEYLNHGLYFGKYGDYIGIDKNDMSDYFPENAPDMKFYQMDFLEDIDKILSLQFFDSKQADTVVSLFGIETIMDSYDKYELYRKIFRESYVKSILTSGVVRSRHSPFTRFNGNKIYMSNEHPLDFFYPEEFCEERFYRKVQSKLFGNEIEVWKILTNVEKVEK